MLSTSKSTSSANSVNTLSGWTSLANITVNFMLDKRGFIGCNLSNKRRVEAEQNGQQRELGFPYHGIKISEVAQRYHPTGEFDGPNCNIYPASCVGKAKKRLTMCSITAILNANAPADELRAAALSISKRQRHRGPDWSGVFQHERAVLAHERLAIVDVTSGAQPLIDSETGTALAVNGEIYNHKSLRARTTSFPYQTGSDCEVILGLYREHGVDLAHHLEGMFAFVLYDVEKDAWLIGRDPIGIIPLYYGHTADGALMVASEMKGLEPLCEDVGEFPPGHVWSSADAAPKRYYTEDWMDWETAPKQAYKKEELRAALEQSVKSHLMGDVPYGLLISGGLDSRSSQPLRRTSRKSAWTTKTIQMLGGPKYTALASASRAVQMSPQRKSG